MNDFCDFLKGFDSSEAFMGKLVEAARGGLPDKIHVVRKFKIIHSDENDPNHGKEKTVVKLMTYSLVEVSGDIDPRMRYKYVCNVLDQALDSSPIVDVPSVKAAILKAEILNYELLDGTADIEVPDVATEGTFDSMYHEMTVDEYYEAERLN